MQRVHQHHERGHVAGAPPPGGLEELGPLDATVKLAESFDASGWDESVASANGDFVRRVSDGDDAWLVGDMQVAIANVIGFLKNGIGPVLPLQPMRRFGAFDLCEPFRHLLPAGG